MNLPKESKIIENSNIYSDEPQVQPLISDTLTSNTQTGSDLGSKYNSQSTLPYGD